MCMAALNILLIRKSNSQIKQMFTPKCKIIRSSQGALAFSYFFVELYMGEQIQQNDFVIQSMRDISKNIRTSYLIITTLITKYIHGQKYA